MTGYLRCAYLQALLPGLIMVVVPAGAAAQSSLEEKTTASRLLTACGVPNDEGQLRWPLGLALLAAPGADELRGQIEALLGVAARQAAAGAANPALVDEARQAVKQLRRLFFKDKAEHFATTLAVYQESERFLTKLERAGQLLRRSTETQGGELQSRAGGSSAPAATDSSLEKESFPLPAPAAPYGQAYPDPYGPTTYPDPYGQIYPDPYGQTYWNSWGTGTATPSGRAR